MSDSVKFIFMTLIKVPIVIFVSFFFLNIFAFVFIYFKVLGLSYVAMQEVVENNYIPASQQQQLENYFQEIDEVAMIDNTNLIVGKSTEVKDGTTNDYNVAYCVKPSDLSDDENNITLGGITTNDYRVAEGPNRNQTTTLNSANSSAIQRTQYGTAKTVGVHCDYTIIWPLSYNQSLSDDGESGTGVSGTDSTTNVVNGTDGQGGGTRIQAEYDSNGDVYKNNMGGAGPSITGDDGTNTTTRGLKVTIPINIYYTVPGLKYYADMT